MNSLASVFDNDDTDKDSLTSLTYKAPKQPRPQMVVENNNVVIDNKTSTSISNNESNTTTATTTESTTVLNPPKVLSTATVYLYKVNNSNGEYEMCADGTRLGCVIYGSGIDYKILIYDQKRSAKATFSCSPLSTIVGRKAAGRPRHTIWRLSRRARPRGRSESGLDGRTLKSSGLS